MEDVKMETLKRVKVLLVAVAALLCTVSAGAVERIILVGPKTIGPGWKDKIVIEPRFFADAKTGDVLTVYTDNAQRSAQGTFQNPGNWQAVAEEYKYFGVKNAFRMTVTDEMLPALRQNGVAVGGHDYRIRYATLSEAADYEERIVWKGPAVRMDSNWQGAAEIRQKALSGLKVGDALRLHISRAKPGTAVKLMDFTWNPIDQTVDGAPAGGAFFTYYIDDDAPLIKLSLAGGDDNVAMRIGGKDYQLDALGIVSFVGERSENTDEAQRAPREYTLAPGELFHGEMPFPDDWSGNLRLTAAPFQKCTADDVLLISYKLLPKEEGVVPQMSFRENRGDWNDLETGGEPQWQNLDGNDVVLTFSDASLDRVKTKGLVVTGRGFVLERIKLMKVE
jgi:hypothetical protein